MMMAAMMPEKSAISPHVTAFLVLDFILVIGRRYKR